MLRHHRRLNHTTKTHDAVRLTHPTQIFRFKCQTAKGVMTPHSRGAGSARVMHRTCGSRYRGRTECRVLRKHPQPRVRMKKAHEHSHHRYAETFRHSPRVGFTAYFVLSPVCRA